MIDKDNNVIMKNLNPKDSGKNDVSKQLFPPDEEEFYKTLQSDEFKKILVISATTCEGRNAIAKYFEVDEECENNKSTSMPAEGYYELLLLVKMKSKKDNLWISFIEGLHGHAAMVMSLGCSSFDFENNYINPGSLSMEDFNKAKIPHFQMNDHSPTQQLNNIMERRSRH